MAFYEYVYLIRADLSENQVEELNNKVSEVVVSGFNGKVVKTEKWGLRNLSYKIKKNKKAHYCMFHLDLSYEGLKELQRLHSVNENVLRTLAIKIDSCDEKPSFMMRTPRINLENRY